MTLLHNSISLACIWWWTGNRGCHLMDLSDTGLLKTMGVAAHCRSSLRCIKTDKQRSWWKDTNRDLGNDTTITCSCHLPGQKCSPLTVEILLSCHPLQCNLLIKLYLIAWYYHCICNVINVHLISGFLGMLEQLHPHLPISTPESFLFPTWSEAVRIIDL